MNRSSASTGWAFVATTVVLWASAFPAIRVALESFSPTGLAFARTAVAAFALLVGAPAVGVRRPALRDLRLVLVCAFVGMAAYQVLLNVGERTVPAGTASLIISTAPVYSVVLAGRVLGERTPPRRWLGLFVALVGSGIVASAGESGLSLSRGALAVLAAAVVQGVYHAAQRPLLERYTAYEVATYAMVAGAVMLVPFAPAAVSSVGSASAGSLAAVAFLGLGPSAVGFVTWAAGVSRLDVSRPALALYAVPVVAIAVAWVWLGEVPTMVAVVGGIVSIAGVVLGGRQPRSAPADASND